MKIANISDLQNWLLRSVPPIVLIDNGFWIYSQPHYILVFGFTSDRILYYSDGKEYRMSYREFSERWKKMGNLLLAVYPP